MSNEEDDECSIHRIEFSRDRRSLAVITTASVGIFSTSSFRKLCRISTEATHGDILPHSSLLVTANSNDSTIQLWNVSSSCSPTAPIASVRLFNVETIQSVKLNPRRLIVLTDKSLIIYRLTDLSLLHIVERSGSNRPPLLSTTCSGENGLCAIVIDTGNILLIDTYTLYRYPVFSAHTSAISALDISMDGSLLATASIKGTIVRLFRIRGIPAEAAPSLCGLLRRGRNESPIRSVLFDSKTEWITVVGDSDTAHIYQVPDCSVIREPLPGISAPSILKSFMSIFPKQYADAVEAVRDHSFVRLRRTHGSEEFSGSLVSRQGGPPVVVMLNTENGFAFCYDMTTAKPECRLRAEHALMDDFGSPGIMAAATSATTVDPSTVTLMKVPLMGSEDISAAAAGSSCTPTTTEEESSRFDLATRIEVILTNVEGAADGEDGIVTRRKKKSSKKKKHFDLSVVQYDSE